MKYSEEFKEKVFEEYMAWVNDVLDECEHKVSFSPHEIVSKVLSIACRLSEEGSQNDRV